MEDILNKKAKEFFRKQGAIGGKIGGAKNKEKGSEYFKKIASLRRKKSITKLSTDKPNK